MASMPKRPRNVIRRKTCNDFSDESDDYDSENVYQRKVYNSNSGQTNPNFQYNARPKCFSKNAMLARENRVRKKMYVVNLENDLKRFRDENEQLKTDMNIKNRHIATLKHEIQYLKNVISNSKEIESLLHSINRATGMRTTSSLNSHRKTPRKHPWEDLVDDSYEDVNDNDKLTKYLLDGEMPEPTLTDLTPISSLDIFDPLPPLPVDVNRSESDHSYSTVGSPESEEFGICLHVSNAKVSLEFCSQCSQKATDAWKKEFD